MNVYLSVRLALQGKNRMDSLHFVGTSHGMYLGSLTFFVFISTHLFLSPLTLFPLLLYLCIPPIMLSRIPRAKFFPK